MNIGFYGKGGSGKTTVSVLFSLYLDGQGETVGLLDADVNSHTADVLGIEADKAKILSDASNQKDIWKYLAGNNQQVRPSEFLNTTPPGEGSGRWTIRDGNYLTKRYGQRFGTRSRLFTVGSYTPEAVGIDCHHSTQMVAENMISHFDATEQEALVIDSVAGNDAFGTTLFLNDLLVFVVKPEREGISVMNRFLKLAKSAGVYEKVIVMGNLVGSDKQRAFLEREVPAEKLVGLLDTNSNVVDLRLEDEPLDASCIGDEAKAVFSRVYEAARSKQDKIVRYKKLVELHKKVSAEGWVSGAYRPGLADQIDADYMPV